MSGNSSIYCNRNKLSNNYNIRITHVFFKSQVIENAIHEYEKVTDNSREASSKQAVGRKYLQRLMALRQEVDDREQAKLLSSVSDGIDAVKFASDPVYKTDTILGLAM